MYYFFYSLALLSLSQASVIIRWSGENPLLLGSWRLLIAGLILLIWSKVKNPNSLVRASDYRKIVVTGFTFFAHLFSYAWAAHHTSISHLMLIFSLNPVITALGTWIFFRERLTYKQLLSYALALVGIYILANEKHGSGSIDGDMAALIAAVTFSMYALLSKWSRRDLSNSVFASRMYFSGSFFFFVAAFFNGIIPPIPHSTTGWVGVMLLTLFPTLMGHGVFTLCMQHIPLNVLSIGKLLEPPIAAISAYLLFGERLTSSALVAFLLIVTAVSLVVSKHKSK